MRTWLKDIRTREGLTSCQAAEGAGVTQGYYAMIETGARVPTVEVARRLGKAMCFDWRRLYGGR